MVNEDSDTCPDDEVESEATFEDSHHDSCDEFHAEQQSKSIEDDDDKLQPIHVQVLGPG